MSNRSDGGERSGGYPRVVRAAGLIGAIGAAGLFLAGSVAPWVPPDRFWLLQLFGIVAPYTGIVVLGALVGAVLLRAWVPVACLTFVLLMGYGASQRLYDAPPRVSVADEAPGLVVMSFNAAPSRAGNEQDALAGLLGRERPHLLAMQELPVRLDSNTGRMMGPPLIAPLLRRRAYTISWPPEKNPQIDLPIFSRLDSLRAPTLPVGEGRKGLWASGGVTRAVYEWQGRPIAVYNVHLHSFEKERPWRQGWRQMLSLRAWRSALASFRRDFRTRARQARQLRSLLNAEPLPFIVCGDFNSTSGNWVYAHIREGLHDAFRAEGRGWGKTYPARHPLVRIDFILASPDWTVRRAWVEEAVSSDHRPVIAELALGETAAVQ